MTVKFCTEKWCQYRKICRLKCDPESVTLKIEIPQNSSVMEINNQIFVFTNTTFTRLISRIDNNTATMRFEIDPFCLFTPIDTRWHNLSKIDSGFYDRKLQLMIFLSDNKLFCFDQMSKNAKFSVNMVHVHPEAVNCSFVMLFHAYPSDWVRVRNLV